MQRDEMNPSLVRCAITRGWIQKLLEGPIADDSERAQLEAEGLALIEVDRLLRSGAEAPYAPLEERALRAAEAVRTADPNVVPADVIARLESARNLWVEALARAEGVTADEIDARVESTLARCSGERADIIRRTLGLAQLEELTPDVVASTLTTDDVRRLAVTIKALLDRASDSAPVMPDMSVLDPLALPSQLREKIRGLIGVAVGDATAPPKRLH